MKLIDLTRIAITCEKCSTTIEIDLYKGRFPKQCVCCEHDFPREIVENLIGDLSMIINFRSDVTV